MRPSDADPSHWFSHADQDGLLGVIPVDARAIVRQAGGGGALPRWRGPPTTDPGRSDSSVQRADKDPARDHERSPAELDAKAVDGQRPPAGRP